MNARSTMKALRSVAPAPIAPIISRQDNILACPIHLNRNPCLRHSLWEVDHKRESDIEIHGRLCVRYPKIYQKPA